MPCSACIVNHVTATPAVEPSRPSRDNGDSEVAGWGVAGWSAYQAWDWPVTQHCGQIQLSLHRDASATAIPIQLSIEVTQILTERHCAPAVTGPPLRRPYAPEPHRAHGRAIGAELSWPANVHEVTGVLILPPTMTHVDRSPGYTPAQGLIAVIPGN